MGSRKRRPRAQAVGKQRLQRSDEQFHRALALVRVAFRPHRTRGPEYGHPSRLALVVTEAHDLLNPAVKRRERAGRLGHPRGQPLGYLLGLMPVHGAEQLVLGLKVAVERPGGHPGLSQDVRDGRIAIAVALHDRERGVEKQPQLVTGLETARPPDAGRWPSGARCRSPGASHGAVRLAGQTASGRARGIEYVSLTLSNQISTLSPIRTASGSQPVMFSIILAPAPWVPSSSMIPDT